MSGEEYEDDKKSSFMIYDYDYEYIRTREGEGEGGLEEK